MLRGNMLRGNMLRGNMLRWCKRGLTGETDMIAAHGRAGLIWSASYYNSVIVV